MNTVISLDVTVEELKTMNLKGLYKLLQFVNELAIDMEHNHQFMVELVDLEYDIIHVIGSKMGF